jgi:hypothetical protein
MKSSGGSNRDSPAAHKNICYEPEIVTCTVTPGSPETKLFGIRCTEYVPLLVAFVGTLVVREAIVMPPEVGGLLLIVSFESDQINTI